MRFLIQFLTFLFGWELFIRKSFVGLNRNSELIRFLFWVWFCQEFLPDQMFSCFSLKLLS